MNSILRDSNEAYHSNREFIGSTELRKMEMSELHFYNAWKLKEEEEATQGQVTGNVLHSLLLEQDVEHFIPRPIKDGRLVASNTKEYAAFLAANPGKEPVHPDLYKHLYTALGCFANNKRAMAMLNAAKIEHSIYTTDPETGIRIKARPDIWGSNYIVDLKTTGPLNGYFEKDIFSSGYDMQLAHYGACIEAAGRGPIEEYYIIAFEQKPPYQSKIYQISLSDIEFAKNIRRGYLNQIAVCIKENKWDGYSDEIIKVSKPAYMNNHDALGIFEGVG